MFWQVLRNIFPFKREKPAKAAVRNGSSYVSAELTDWLDDHSMGHTHVAVRIIQ